MRSVLISKKLSKNCKTLSNNSITNLEQFSDSSRASSYDSFSRAGSTSSTVLVEPEELALLIELLVQPVLLVELS